MAENTGPLLLSLDMDAVVMQLLQARGYRVLEGSVGAPYQVVPNGQADALEDSSVLPNGYPEADIVFLNLRARHVVAEGSGRPLGHAGRGWNVVHGQPLIDPRPYVLNKLREPFEQILAHGGVIVVFGDERIEQPCELVENRSRTGFIPDTWSFVECLSSSDVEITGVMGNSIDVLTVATRLDPIATSLRRHADDMRYTCTISPDPSIDFPWTPLAVNKYGAAVSSCVEIGEGLILVVPHLGIQLESFLVDLLTEALPEIKPSLFPDIASGSWVHREEYELPAVLRISEQIDAVESAARLEVAELSKRIDEEKTEQGYQYDLLRGTGQVLTTAVKAALLRLGLERVDDVNEGLREDLRITDSSLSSEIVLVEVKGIGGLPSDEDATQVAKYVPLCMQDDGCLHVHGVSIINYERHIPPLQRNPQPFRPEIVTSSESYRIGLLTTWDVFKLFRGMETYGWRPEHVKRLLDVSGRVAAVPSHYRRLGSVTRFYEQAGAFAMIVTDGAVRVGDVIAFDSAAGFVEQPVTSLQIDGEPTQEARVGAEVGIETGLSKAQVRKGTAVYHADYGTPVN